MSVLMAEKILHLKHGQFIRGSGLSETLLVHPITTCREWVTAKLGGRLYRVRDGTRGAIGR
jgi:hypothetical protein